ncbi:MAG: CHASE2 domain-containing protein [Fidelibacterota bacterium]
MKKNTKNNTRIYFLIPVISIALVIFFNLVNLFDYLELKSIDMRFKIRGEQSLSHSDIIIIAIDEQTYGSLKEKFPYPRSYYAKLIDNLTDAGVKQIIFDIEFTKEDEINPQDDKQLAASIKKAGNVILAGTIIRNIEKQYDYYLAPTGDLRDQSLANGLVNDIHDEDGFVRRYNIFIPCQKKIYYTISTLGYVTEEGLDPRHLGYQRKGKFCLVEDTTAAETVSIRTTREKFWQQQSFMINYYGAAGSFPYYSFSQVLDDSEFELASEWDNDYMEIWKKNSNFPNILRINFLSSENQQLAESLLGNDEKVEEIIQLENPFNNKIALIGSSLPELHDERYTPFYHFENENRLTPGVEIHAHALQTLLDKNYLRKTSILSNLIALLILNYLLVFFAQKYRPLKGAGITALTLLVLFFVSVFLFSMFNLIMPLIMVVSSLVLSYFSVLGVEFFNEEKEKRKIRNMFQTYTSAKVLKFLEENPDSFSLKGERREATILFSDVAGFTTISENLSAKDLSTLLNRYLTPMTRIMMKYDGYVDKYQGDGIMCNFGVPIVDNDHAWKACFSALEQLAVLDSMRGDFITDFGFDVDIRIGINTGILSAGNMGSAERFQYSVIGDVVNQAARFESANKQYGTRIMIGEETFRKAGNRIVARVLDKIVVKGKAKPVKVYNLVGRSNDISDELMSFVKFYNSGMDDYFSRNWSGAIDNFQKALTIQADYAAELMINRTKEFLKNPPPDDWHGEFILTSK